MAKKKRFLGLRGKEARKAKLRIRQELFDLREENQDLDGREFRDLALETFRDRYEGIDIGKLEQILELILKYLPMILALFSFIFVLFVFTPSSANAQDQVCSDGSCQIVRSFPVLRSDDCTSGTCDIDQSSGVSECQSNQGLKKPLIVSRLRSSTPLRRLSNRLLSFSLFSKCGR